MRIVLISVLVTFPVAALAQVSTPTPNQRFSGSDLYAFDLQEAEFESIPPSAVSCQLACLRNKNCVGYTWVREGIEASVGRCHLKSSLGTAVSDSCCASGKRTGPDRTVAVALPPGVPPPYFTVLSGIDRSGSGYSTTSLGGTDPVVQTNSCQALCSNDSRCGAFVVRRPTGAPAQCVLQAPPVVAGTPCATCTTGVKIASSSTPAANFGFMRYQAFDSTRPLLVVLLHYTDGGSGFAAYQTADYYKNLIFGPGEPNVADYYYESSGGQFSFVNAGVLGPFSAASTSDNRGLAKQLAAAAGFQFAKFDRNGDGVIDTTELGVLVIDDGSFGSGQTANNGVALSGLAENSATSLTGVSSEFDNYAHELAHQLYQDDIYGAACFGYGMSVASCTAADGGPMNAYVSEYPDAYHRLRWGWNPPLVISTADYGACSTLDAAQSGYGRTLLFYDPVRGPDEFFMAEFRNGTAESFVPISELGLDGAMHQVSSYDQSFPTRNGVLFWWIKTLQNGSPYEQLVEINPGPDGALESLPLQRDDVLRGTTIGTGPNGILDTHVAPTDVVNEDMSIYPTFDPRIQASRNGAWWTPPVLSSGRAPLIYWLDSTLSGIRVHVPSLAANAVSTAVEWGTLRLRIDSLTPSTLSPNDPGFTAAGQFGVDNDAGDRVALLTSVSTGTTYRLTPTGWSCGQLQFARPQVPPGSYRLQISASNSVSSNVAMLTVH